MRQRAVYERFFVDIAYNNRSQTERKRKLTLAIEVREPQRILFISGTMGLDERGVAGKTLAEQLDLLWSNIRVILASAGMTVDNIVRLTSYLRDPAHAEANARARVAALGGRLVPTTAIVAQTLASDWLVEIEVIAAA